jgi:hypothetical protein
MMKKNLFGCFVAAMTALALVGSPLYAGGGNNPTLKSIDVDGINLGIVPLSSTTVGIGEDVLFEVTILNNSENSMIVDLWFTVDLSGLENEKQVRTPSCSVEAYAVTRRSCFVSKPNL